MNQGIVIVVVALALIAIMYMWTKQQEAARLAAQRSGPWAQLGSGVGQIITGIGGFVNA